MPREFGGVFWLSLLSPFLLAIYLFLIMSSLDSFSSLFLYVISSKCILTLFSITISIPLFVKRVLKPLDFFVQY